MLPARLFDRVLHRLGVPVRGSPTFERLVVMYRAWCRAVPFDNVRKMIALRGSPGAALPGIEAEDLFEAWLAHGVGGTCWPTSNGLCALLHTAGFDVRRVTASMRDVGVENHGSLVVRLDGKDWLVDSSMLLEAPLPLRRESFVHDHLLYPARVAYIDGGYVVRYDVPPHTDFPCRILADPVDESLYRHRYQTSRHSSPFNARLYARRNVDGGLILLRGTTRYVKTVGGLHAAVLDGDQLVESLLREFGMAPGIVDAWARSGALADTLASIE